MPRNILLWAGLMLAIADTCAHAQARLDTLTAERVVALARTRAPSVRVAESDVMAARGRLAGARALGQENPTIEGVAATEERFERRTQWELNVPIGIGLSWLGRTGVARAELLRDEQLVGDARRGAVGAALAAYYRLLHARDRALLATERRSLATDLVRTATERHRSGEAPRLEVLLTETEEARAESERLAEEESVVRARVELALALGFPSLESVAVAGDLSDRSVVASLINAGGSTSRPDVTAAESELRAAKAAGRLASTDLLPSLGFRLDYGHEEGEAIVQPGVAVSVPLFQYGQESRRLARAREMRASADLERLRNAAAVEREGMRLAYQAATAASEELQSRAMSRVQESEGMARESYRAGKVDLPTLLVVRRDLLETRREYLDRLLNAALASIDLAVAEGHFQ